MNEQVMDHVERIAELLATPVFGEESRRRQLNEKFEVLKRMRESNDKLFGTHKDTDPNNSK
jgi:hypothetical protein